MKNEDLHREMEAIRLEAEDAILRPKAVVKSASDPDSPLHEHFDWNNKSAAHKYRLATARRLIRFVVMTLPGSDERFNAYTNLTIDRGKGGAGGYRTTLEIMGSDELMAHLLTDALAELRAFEQKYNTVKKLSVVFEAYQEVLAEESEGTRKRKQSRRSVRVGKKKAKKKAAKKVAKKKTKKKKTTGRR